MKNSQSNKNLSGGVDKQVTFREKEWYRENIVEIINETEDLKYLEFIYKLLLSFKKKWGV